MNPQGVIERRYLSRSGVEERESDIYPRFHDRRIAEGETETAGGLPARIPIPRHATCRLVPAARSPISAGWARPQFAARDPKACGAVDIDGMAVIARQDGVSRPRACYSRGLAEAGFCPPATHRLPQTCMLSAGHRLLAAAHREYVVR